MKALYAAEVMNEADFVPENTKLHRTRTLDTAFGDEPSQLITLKKESFNNLRERRVIYLEGRNSMLETIFVKMRSSRYKIDLEQIYPRERTSILSWNKGF